jgi:hypothetical protein
MERFERVNHPDDGRLVAWLDEEVPAAEVESLLGHLDSCARCSARLEQLEPAFGDCRRALDRMHAYTPRPVEWLDITEAMFDLERRRGAAVGPRVHEDSPLTGFFRPGRIFRAAWMTAAAAAGLFIALILLPRGEQSSLRAEELLRQAQFPAARAATPRRLRVKTRASSFIHKTGSPAGTEESALRARFAAADYDWSEPLSAKAFADWRRGLARKSDRVVAHRDPATRAVLDYTLETGAPDSGLREASLTLEAGNFAPVSGKFLFADREWVEISAAPDAERDTPAVSAPPVESAPRGAASKAVRPRVAADASGNLLTRELKVFLAIDALEPDGEAGVPISVDADNSNRVVVTAYRLTPGREAQLRASLAAIEGVVMNTPGDAAQSETARAAVPLAPQTAGDAAIDASQAVSAQAHLLGQIAARFDTDAAGALTADDRKTLRELEARHARKLIAQIARLERSLEESGHALDAPGAAGPDRGNVTQLVESAAEVNRLVTVLFAGFGKPADENAANTGWTNLGASLARLRTLAGQYALSLGVTEARQ